ncbi:methylmalonate-semialdehyde dehydrogenase [acylating], mitochondrial-like [Silene latifolia]|uniref:methylmalonate-semialdehyde dehydrogenase [acylating], mitochondrial-like n=1 Tax=Silene latifolia TaxID=37657 RepID=UPI003D772B8D
MDLQSSESTEPQMLPPRPGRFASRDQMIEHVGDFGVSQGYVVTIKHSKKDIYVLLGCDRGGKYRDRRKNPETDSAESSRTQKSRSRRTNCQFELYGRKEDGVWVLSVRNGTHNHEPMKDLSEHPACRRFKDDEILQIKEMTEAGLKPRQILKRLRKKNPELLSTPKQVYNVKAKLRSGVVTAQKFKCLRPLKGPNSSFQTPAATEATWRQRLFPRVPNFIEGSFLDSQSSATIDVINPANQQVVYILPITTIAELKAAVFAAKRAFDSWRNTPVLTRQRIILKFRELIHRDKDKLASSIAREVGKTLKNSYRDVYSGLEALDLACDAATSDMGQFVSSVANGVDVYSIREPLGVCAGMCLSNLSAIIALWMFPLAVVYGNTFILKSSLKDPGVCMMLAELASEAGLPNGVLNIVHGTDDIVNAICDDDDVKAISVAASKTYGMYVFSRASPKGTRVQNYTEGSSHVVVMPDANVDYTLNVLVGVAFRAEGERCFAVNTVIFVGDSKSWESKLVERAIALKVTAGTEPDADVGPVISKQEKERICKVIQSGIEKGARLILDGRNIVVPGYPHGNFIGPTIICDVTTDMGCYQEKIFGPVIMCMQVKSLEEAINLVNECRHSNGASIFTTSGASARKFQISIETGQIGINVPVSVPMPFISSTHPEASFPGQAGSQFFTKTKTVRQQWNEFPMEEEAGVPILMD